MTKRSLYPIELYRASDVILTETPYITMLELSRTVKQRTDFEIDKNATRLRVRYKTSGTSAPVSLLDDASGNKAYLDFTLAIVKDNNDIVTEEFVKLVEAAGYTYQHSRLKSRIGTIRKHLELTVGNLAASGQLFRGRYGKALEKAIDIIKQDELMSSRELHTILEENGYKIPFGSARTIFNTARNKLNITGQTTRGYLQKVSKKPIQAPHSSHDEVQSHEEQLPPAPQQPVSIAPTNEQIIDAIVALSTQAKELRVEHEEWAEERKKLLAERDELRACVKKQEELNSRLVSDIKRRDQKTVELQIEVSRPDNALSGRFDH